MSSFQNQNQFQQTNELGTLVLGAPNNVQSALINPSSVATILQNGTPVKLITGQIGDSAGNGQALVDAITDPPNDVFFGIILYSRRQNQHSPGDTVEIATAPSEVWLEAAGTINRGDTVQANNTGPTVTSNSTSGQQEAGIAIGQCTVGQLIAIRLAPAKHA